MTSPIHNELSQTYKRYFKNVAHEPIKSVGYTDFTYTKSQRKANRELKKHLKLKRELIKQSKENN